MAGSSWPRYAAMTASKGSFATPEPSGSPKVDSQLNRSPFCVSPGEGVVVVVVVEGPLASKRSYRLKSVSGASRSQPRGNAKGSGVSHKGSQPKRK